jgi:hypothetical protein
VINSPAQASLLGSPGPAVDNGGRLDATLARVGELCRALGAGESNLEPAALLSELRVDLELHFALEESDSQFGAVLRERPSLSQDVSELKHEHAALLERLDALRTIASDRSRWSELRAPTLALVEAFRAHEHHEGSLLQELVLRDDGIGPD